MLLTELQKRLQYHFQDETLLVQALTHKSFAHETLPTKPVSLRDNERLEFLGDSILDAVLSDLLIERCPEADEGTLSKMRAAIVNERTLAEVADKLELGPVLKLGKGEEQTGGRAKPSITSSALEALIAAVYLDGGFEAVYPVVDGLMSSVIETVIQRGQVRDPKTLLQEMIQAKWRVTPSYHILNAVGPDHAKEFEVEVRLKGKCLAVAKGASKKQAEQNAAESAIREFN
jgi:ribonuclease III